MGLPPMTFAGLGLPIQQRYSTPADQGIVRYWSADQDKINPAATHFMGFTLHTSGPGGSEFLTIGEHNVLQIILGMGRVINVKIANGRVWTERENYTGVAGAAAPADVVASPKVTIPTGQDKVDIFVMWDNTEESGSRAQVRAGSNSTGLIPVGSPVMSGGNPAIEQIAGRVTIGQALPLSDVYYSTRNFHGGGPDDFGQGFRTPKYVANMDRGLNRFSHMPKPKATDAWDIITSVAASEMGAVFWDESGRFQFWNFDTIAQKQDLVVRDFDLDHAKNLTVTDSLDSVRNVYTVQTNKKRAIYGGQALYSSSDPNEFYVPGGTIREFQLWRDDVESPLTFFMQKYTTLTGTGFPAWDDSVVHGYCIQYLINGVWQERGDRTGVDIRVYFTNQGFLKVSIWNGWSEPIRLASGSADNSRGAFRFTGTKVTDDAPVSNIYRNYPSIDKYGPRNLELKGDWWQDGFARTLLVPKMIVRTAQPIPATDNIPIPGDPRLQLGDTIRVNDPDGIGDGIKLQILGVKRTFNAQGLSDTLTVEMVSPLPKQDPVPIWSVNDRVNPKPPPDGGTAPGGGTPGGGDENTAAAKFNWGSPHSISDEFNYTGPPDPNKWNNAPEGGMAGHNGNGRRVAYCATVANGKMTLRGYPNGDTAWVMQKLETQYGRWEVRCRSQSVGSSGNPYHILNLIWPTSGRWPNDGEYDWLELEDPDATSAQGYLHYPHPNMPVQQEFVSKAGINANDWHNYAFEWTSSHLKGFIDGVEWYTLSGGANGSRSNIQAMPSGHLIHQVDNFYGSGMREAIMEIEWVRFYPVS